MTDASLRLATTLGLLALFAILEWMRPARPSHLSVSRLARHGVLSVLGSLVSRLMLAGGLASVASFVQLIDFGLVNWLQLTGAWVWVACFLILDFAVWGQHVLSHKIPFLWRLHRLHHCDVVMDVTTALRFHPFEIVASLIFKGSIVALLGAPPALVFAFELVLGAGALFTHANIALPNRLDRLLRWALVTPAMHLIHHNPNPVATNSNYGFSFSIWDRLFGTYRADGPELPSGAAIGLERWRSPQDQTLKAMVLNPFA
ncbi:MAG: sterol desaturase family protein [Hyphomonadaceae bacterium]|jgi:sterol desaturase/sphingolipid hydroxylase (fatty acid hydroxylase superfamily)|uniref:sterol desaturase family protein n=1 Tax=Aquidulcibacter sp. TaxID=2052990 RepID=UPI0022CAED99|nr:sterol desaturase family protein [Aquidulcibacter sp.]MCE2892254.1 sterol desaturase family protein [Hyphomonadaceae bacterium]MCZ8207562.1 sterol desaturase family protein [Aquidulcibacter sp.]